MQSVPDACLLPVASSSPAGDPAVTPHLLRQHLPCDGRLQHKVDPSQGRSVCHRQTPTFRFGPRGWQERLKDCSQFVAG